MYDLNVDIIPTSTKNSVVGNKSGSIYDRVKRNYEYFCIFKLQTLAFQVSHTFISVHCRLATSPSGRNRYTTIP